jgi:hypothetical protein
MKRLKKIAPFIVTAILAGFIAISLIVSSQESTTMDEQAHIPSAYTYIKYNDMRLNPEHPPLLKDLAGIPLQFLDTKFPDTDTQWTEGVNAQWYLGNTYLHTNNADAITFWSRFPIILIGALLGFFIYRWTKELAGTAAGLLALIFYAFDPNILGHSHYVTTDIGIAAFIFISFYYFVKFLKNPSWKNTLLSGVFLGLAELAKFSAVLLFPIFGMLLIGYAIAKKKPSNDQRTKLRYAMAKLLEYVGKYAVSIVVCFILIWVLYAYNTINMPAEKLHGVANFVFSDAGAGKYAKAFVIYTSNIPLLKPLSEYFLGVLMVFVRVTGGNTYYFLGNVSNHASPAYFPVVFLLKETLPFLLLMIAALGASLIQTFSHIKQQQGSLFGKVKGVTIKYLRNGVTQYSMMLFVAIYVYLSVTGNLNIGFRHLFPILPFLYVLVAKKIVEIAKALRKNSTHTIFYGAMLVLLLWIVAEPIIYYPSYISYFNEAAGGPSSGYKYVTDSNTDWGQDLKRLSNWVNSYNALSPEDPISKIRVDYFGGSSPKYYFGDNFIPWHADLDPEAGWYAISAGFLQESIYKQKNPGDNSYEWLTDKKPYTRIGDSIFVYYIPEIK